MPTIPSLTATCPICKAVLELKDFETEIDESFDESIECPDCKNDLDWEFDDETKALTLIDPDTEDEEEIEGEDSDDEEEEEDEEDDE